MSPDGHVLHASAVAMCGRGLLILGPSGAGKSSLALELISRGGTLIADDRVEVEGAPPRLSPPAAIAGLIEARGIGLLRLPHLAGVPAVLAVDLGAAAEARMPQRKEIRINSTCLPLIAGANNPTLAAALAAGLCSGERFPWHDAGAGGLTDDEH